MAYQLGALIGALGGGNQTVTTATVAFGTGTVYLVKIGRVVQITLPTNPGNSYTTATVPADFKPAAPVYIPAQRDYTISTPAYFAINISGTISRSSNAPADVTAFYISAA